ARSACTSALPVSTAVSCAHTGLLTGSNVASNARTKPRFTAKKSIRNCACENRTRFYTEALVALPIANVPRPEKGETPPTEDIDVNEVIEQVEELGLRSKIIDIESKDGDTVKVFVE
ncbi:MAG: hypothetical protein ACE5FE_01875, partial [Acidiferrobacterales bacterium]